MLAVIENNVDTLSIIIKFAIVILFIMFLILIFYGCLSEEAKKFIKQGFYINIGILLSTATIGFISIILAIIILQIISW